MSFYEDTIQTCRSFLAENPHVGVFFERDEDCSSTGFLYEYNLNGLRLVMDLTVDRGLTSGVRLVAHTGLQANRNALSYVIRWCQMYSPPGEPGILAVSPETRYIDYVINAPNEDGSVSARTLEWLNACACGKVEASYGTLEKLASGRPDFRHMSGQEWMRPIAPDFPEESLRAAKRCLAGGFRNTKQHMIFRNPDDDGGVLYFNRIKCGGDVFYERISVDCSGCLILSVRPERRFPDDEPERLSFIVNQMSGEDQFSGLRCLGGDGYLWFCIPVSLWDEISFDTIALLECLALSSLAECLKRLDSPGSVNRGFGPGTFEGPVLPEEEDHGEPDHEENDTGGYFGISPGDTGDEELDRILGPDPSPGDGADPAAGHEPDAPLLSEDAIELDDSIYIRSAAPPCGKDGAETDTAGGQIAPDSRPDIGGLLKRHEMFLKRNGERESRAKERWRAGNGEEDGSGISP